ncbi:MAG TPA: SDR family NAD(P)-dependent oxidoreductase [Polyangiaceae bacterium]|nr:SDR family NAD(P)-dependent oxidoreductase [Polyangiaceae bacterium]
MQRLLGKRAIVTGAASGIGRASALLFAEHGASLVITDLNAEGLAETAASIESSGGRVSALPGDASEPAHVQNLVQTCVADYGAPDVFYANAGISGLPVTILEERLEDWERTLRVNLIGCYLAIKTVAPEMIKAGKGSIILTASVAGLRSGAGPAAYSASKAGVISLAQTAACQFATRGIRVNAICPGLIQTGMTQPIFEYAISTGKQARLGKHSPMQRPAQPAEVAALALFLASDEASYVTGQHIAVDGGLTATHPFTPGRVI